MRYVIYYHTLLDHGFYKFLNDLYSCQIEIIKGLTDKGQFQYLTELKGSQEETYLDTTQFIINILSESI